MVLYPMLLVQKTLQQEHVLEKKILPMSFAIRMNNMKERSIMPLTGHNEHIKKFVPKKHKQVKYQQ